MRIGSLVENTILIDTGNDDCVNFKYNGGIFPVVGNIYTVRGFKKGIYGLGIYLEEIINPEMPMSEGRAEPSFIISFFREIQPPMEVKIDELLTVEA